MIQSNELRTGNWVYDPQADKNIQIQAAHILMAEQGTKSFMPVALTTDILIKSGFTKDFGYIITPGFFAFKKDNYWILRDTFKLDKTEPDKYYFHMRISCAGNNDRSYVFVNAHVMDIESLHQLQNLYFSLSGRELTVGFYETAVN